MGKEALRLSTVLAATPQVIYRAWFDSTQHAAFTNAPAKVDGNIGGRFTFRDGEITGRNMALEFGRRLLQSWRNTDFPKSAPDSRLEVLFESVGAGTRMTVMHADLPEGMAEPLRAFWTDAYFGPMTDYFGKFATILANTPPSQAVIALDEEEEDEPPAPAPPAKKVKVKPALASAVVMRGPAKSTVPPAPPPSKKATLLLPPDEKTSKTSKTSKADPVSSKKLVVEATKKPKSNAKADKPAKKPTKPKADKPAKKPKLVKADKPAKKPNKPKPSAKADKPAKKLTKPKPKAKPKPAKKAAAKPKAGKAKKKR